MQSGVVFRAGDELHFLPASVAVKVMPMPDVARVPGGPPALVGVAIVDGETLPVVAIGETPRASPRVAMLVLGYLGEKIGLVGLEVLATGRFARARAEGGGGDAAAGDDGTSTSTSGSVEFGGREARVFDLAALVARISAGRWAV